MRRTLVHGGACLTIVVITTQIFCSLESATAECIDYGEYLRCLGGVATPGLAYDVAVSGNYAYVTSHYSILQVIDVSDPQNLRIVGSIDTPGRGDAVAVSGTFAYVASSALLIIDIGNPQKPEIVGNLTLAARDVAVSGGFAYAVSQHSGLHVIDIANPRSPKIAGRADTPGQATGVTISGNHVYVADGESGLRVIDISNPQWLRLVCSVDTPGLAFDVAVSGSFAYVADATALRVIDITNLSTPRIVGSVPTYARGGVAVSGTTAYVAGAGLQIINITNPQDPKIEGGMALWDGYGVAVSGDFAYLATRSGLHVFDITTPQSPPLVGAAGVTRSNYYFGEVAVSGAYVYVVESEYEEYPWMDFLTIDITNAARPQIMGRVRNLSARGMKIAVSGNYAYVSGSRGDDDPVYHLWVIEIANPAYPQVVSHMNIPARDIAVSGCFIYVTGGNSGLLVIDVSDPAHPLIVGGPDTPGEASGVAVAGTLIYVADGSSGLQVFDITNPQRPQLVGSLDTQGLAFDVAVSGSFAYVADGPSGLHVVDITNPASPQIVGSLGALDSQNVAVSGTTAYVRSQGLHMIDVSNAQNPRIVGQSGNWVEGFAVSGDYVYIAAGDEGLQIVPLQCDSAPHRPPIASAGGPYTGECHMPLTFDAVGSMAQDGHIVSYQWDWNGDGIFDEVSSSPTIPHTYETVFAGSVRLRITDDQDPPMTSECEAQVSVADTKVPQIVNVSLLPDVEWTKSQQMVAFQLAVEDQDLCDPNPSSRIVSVTIDPANHPTRVHADRVDWEVTDALSLKLPLDFSQGRTGRLYRVTLVSSDVNGNASAATAEIRVAFARGRPLILLESLELDQELPVGFDDVGGDSSRHGSGEEEVSKSGSSTYALGLLGTFPNPMGLQGHVQFFLPATAHVQLAIYDVRGRLVRTLAQGDYSPGLHSPSWESRADDGSMLSQGIYFARLDVDGQRFTRRFVVVR